MSKGVGAGRSEATTRPLDAGRASACCIVRSTGPKGERQSNKTGNRETGRGLAKCGGHGIRRHRTYRSTRPKSFVSPAATWRGIAPGPW